MGFDVQFLNLAAFGWADWRDVLDTVFVADDNVTH
ncbi:hypothetical protein GP2143_00667 [marine gamma proteobacterium HTCC2143]|uniref:Uncharacterized protein n=1 Tax=marine gamma proteobacterium HTCC2143 TaxID=247633 RepID=A0YF11_9GAMM|nr:hypothetical protein GP2143_00667 [marine gamma proteobacterium HTCC2143]